MGLWDKPSNAIYWTGFERDSFYGRGKAKGMSCPRIRLKLLSRTHPINDRKREKGLDMPTDAINRTNPKRIRSINDTGQDWGISHTIGWINPTKFSSITDRGGTERCRMLPNVIPLMKHRNIRQKNDRRRDGQIVIPPNATDQTKSIKSFLSMTKKCDGWDGSCVRMATKSKKKNQRLNQKILMAYGLECHWQIVF